MRTFVQKQKTPQQAKTAISTTQDRAYFSQSPAMHSTLHLQRTINNQAAQRLLHDNSELEDQIGTAIEAPYNTLTPSQDVTASKIVSGTNNGEPLPPDTRATMETGFGYDFSRVRIHTDSQIAAALGAKAFASGQHIFFGPGRGPSDQPLLAHEITHVVQQATGEVNGLHGAGGDKSRREALESSAEHQSKRMAGVIRHSCQPLRPLPFPWLAPTVLQFNFEEDVLHELHRLPSAEEEGISAAEQRRRADVITGRSARLRALFGRVSSEEARQYYERLRLRRRGDTLSERFHDILATATRRELLGILESKFSTPQQEEVEGPTYGDLIRRDQTIRIGGLPTAQPNYADHAFQGISSAPLGEVYNFYPRFEGGRGESGIPIPKREFHLDDDPLTGFTIVEHRVYRSRDIAESVLADLSREMPDTHFVTYYLRDGYIFPTTLSETTLPILIHNLRRVQENDRAALRATSDLAENLLWWYVGARLPIRVGRGRTSGAPSAGRQASREAARGGTVAAEAAFSAAHVADELLAATQAIANPGQRMLAAARQLSAMRNLTAVQKAEVILEFFRGIGFTIRYVQGATWVDEGAHLVMYAENSRYTFRFVKSTGEILYGRLNMQTLEYAWEVLR